MDKSYYVQGRRVTVEELDTFIARISEKKDPAGGESQALRQAIRARAQRDEQGVDYADADTQLRAFEAAGWTFEEGSKEIDPQTRGTARVFHDQDGRILLGTDQLTVRLDAALGEDECRKVLAAEGLDVVRQLKFAPNLYEVRVRPGAHFLDVSRRLHDRYPFLYAEPEFVEHISTRFRPTDPFFSAQWQWPKIHAEDAWDFNRGAGMRVAVIDKGFDLEHDDLEDAIAGSSGFFDRAGTFVQDQDPLTYPFGNHGTFCAGMAVARANNGGHGCGIANEADLIAVSCLPDEVGTQATLARALAYAADPSMEVAGANPADGANVISCSLGPRNSAVWKMKQVLRDAIDFAVTKGRAGLGTPIFWAVTNGNFEIRFDEVCSYANVIAVGRSTDRDDHGVCGFGPQLHFLAPGVDVVSTQAGNTLGVETGTSFAAPIAAGIAALMIAKNAALTWTDVRRLLRETCDKVVGAGGGVVYDANGHHDRFGFGRVNAAEAVRRA